MKDNRNFGSSQSLIDAVNEVLKGGQKKLDKNNNGKIDGDDFKKLRGDDEVDEVAASMTQQRAAGAALATQRGEYDGGKKGGAINRMSAMKPSDLMKIAGTKKNELPMRKEEAEQVDELSKSTMGSYIKKASSDVAGRVGDERDRRIVVDAGVNRYRKNKIQNRERGIGKAVDKLTKEDAVMKAIKSMKAMKAKESTSY